MPQTVQSLVLFYGTGKSLSCPPSRMPFIELRKTFITPAAYVGIQGCRLVVVISQVIINPDISRLQRCIYPRHASDIVHELRIARATAVFCLDSLRSCPSSPCLLCVKMLVTDSELITVTDRHLELQRCPYAHFLQLCHRPADPLHLVFMPFLRQKSHSGREPDLITTARILLDYFICLAPSLICVCIGRSQTQHHQRALSVIIYFSI